MVIMEQKNPNFTGGQKFGWFIIAAAILTPAFFWGVTYWRDLTNTYCSGECASGWYAVISTFLALPLVILGTIILAVATVRKHKKTTL
jgi:hypothetical protein